MVVSCDPGPANLGGRFADLVLKLVYMFFGLSCSFLESGTGIGQVVFCLAEAVLKTGCSFFLRFGELGILLTEQLIDSGARLVDFCLKVAESRQGSICLLLRRGESRFDLRGCIQQAIRRVDEAAAPRSYGLTNNVAGLVRGREKRLGCVFTSYPRVGLCQRNLGVLRGAF